MDRAPKPEVRKPAIDCVAHPLGMLATFLAVLFLAELTYNLIDAYAFGTNHTDVSYYAVCALFFPFTRQFTAVYHFWGVPLIAAQLLLLYWIVRRKWSLVVLIPILAVSQTVLAFVSDVIHFGIRGVEYHLHWESIAALLLAFFVVGVIWAVARSIQKIRWQKRPSSIHPGRSSANIVRRNVRSALASTIPVAFCLAAASWLYIEIWLPNKQLQTPEWSAGDPISERTAAKARRACHKVLSQRFGNHHDAFLLLESVGNTDSIPYLIRALKWQDPPDDEGYVICTTHHCVQLLSDLTGLRFMYDHEQWKNWWDETGSTLSAEQLGEQAKKAREAANKALQETSYSTPSMEYEAPDG